MQLNPHLIHLSRASNWFRHLISHAPNWLIQFGRCEIRRLNQVLKSSQKFGIYSRCTKFLGDIVWFQKTSIPTTRMVIGNSEGGRALKSQNFKRKVWSETGNSSEVGVSEQKSSILVGGMDIFCNHTFSKNLKLPKLLACLVISQDLAWF